MGRIPAATRETVPSGRADAFDQLLAGAGSVSSDGSVYVVSNNRIQKFSPEP